MSVQYLRKEMLTQNYRLRDDDMAYLLGMNTKELHKLCGKLKEDRWLAVSVIVSCINSHDC